jgi:hypothetical protein
MAETPIIFVPTCRVIDGIFRPDHLLVERMVPGEGFGFGQKAAHGEAFLIDHCDPVMSERQQRPKFRANRAKQVLLLADRRKIQRLYTIVIRRYRLHTGLRVIPQHATIPVPMHFALSVSGLQNVLRLWSLYIAAFATGKRNIAVHFLSRLP